ncbi:MAG: FAD:protein FMN transferase [Verrucomicrobiaceae bacterium]|nr:FAD:protein FMN transferase [Verrucomicrobiaceae bacterium]
MATTFRIHLYATDPEKAKAAVDAAFERVAKLNGVFSDYEPGSELMQLCTSGKSPFPASADLFSIVQRAGEISTATAGAFDISCGHLTRLWRRTRNLKKLPPADRLTEAISLTNWQAIQLDPATRSITLTRPKMLLDLGGIAKGRAADEMLAVLRKHGFPIASVQAGGDTVCGDPPPGEKGWQVALRTFSSPEEDTAALPTIRLAHAAVSTSGDLYQTVVVAGVSYSHIVSPKTGLGLTNRIACSVVAPDATTSDALATACCIMGADQGHLVIEALPGVSAHWVGLEENSSAQPWTATSAGFPELHLRK